MTKLRSAFLIFSLLTALAMPVAAQVLPQEPETGGKRSDVLERTPNFT